MGDRLFTSLNEAVDFLAVRLEADDPEGIADQCSNGENDDARTAEGLPSPRSYRLHAIRELGRRHGMQNLRSTYAGREFPSDRDEFKLGGHGAELGHTHIDFSRTGLAWKIKEIWMCR